MGLMEIPDYTTALPDWERRIVSGGCMVPCGVLYPEEAYAALEQFKGLRAVDVAGSPTFGECCDSWVFDFVLAIFGSYNTQSGQRIIQEFFLLISKKNGKSTIAAGIMVVLLLRNWRMSSEFLILAPTIEVAKNSFEPARDMIRADDELSDLLTIQEHTRTITHTKTNSVLKVVAASAETVSGKKAAFVLVDELWLFGKNPRAENMLTEATGGLVARPEGCVIYLTTQSDEPPLGVFKDKLDYARDVRDGKVIDKQFLAVIYEFPARFMDEEKSYLKPENFYITNPNLGRSVSLDWLVRKLGQVQQAGEKSLRPWLAKHLNIEVGMNLRADRWPGAKYWAQAGRMQRNADVEYILARSEVVTIGLDGGGLDDLFGMVVLGRDFETGEWLQWEHAWAHPSVMEERKDIITQLELLKKEGDLTIVDEHGQDLDEVSTIAKQVNDSGLLYQIGMDSGMIGSVMDALVDKEIEDDKIVFVNQGYRLAGSIKTTERKLTENVLVHRGSALMNWNVGNAKVKTVGNSIYITKAMSGTAKIDALIALFNAVALMQLNPPSQLSQGDFSEMVIG